MPRTALIIGAGPAGLTAAYELLTRSDIRPVVLEASDALGGLSRTVNHCGNRIDIGGHRFFSKSQRVMSWWADMLPLEAQPEGANGGSSITLTYHGRQHDITSGPGPDPRHVDEVMLLRPRKSRIFYDRKLFDYPLSLSFSTLANLGPLRTLRIGLSYLKSRLRPILPERDLEEFFINRFGRELYRTFFQSYTEKVWGTPCRNISAAWGAQRIKGLSIGKAVAHALRRLITPAARLATAQTETSLVEQFLYPKLGPGQMWETCARRVEQLGGEVHLRQRVQRVLIEGQRAMGVVTVDASGQEHTHRGDFVFSTMPIRELVPALDTAVPTPIAEIAAALVYRDFITVGLLLERLTIDDTAKYPSDNWIYIQEPDVKLGRLQIFNNWSPYLVVDRERVWLGLEYFCNEGDELWSLADEAMTDFAVEELIHLGLCEWADVVDSTVIRVPKTYPAYFGAYERFDELREWIDRFENLFLIGRNGMHRYNNQDHSMLTAMTAVDNILAGGTDKANIWGVNTEDEYHESR